MDINPVILAGLLDKDLGVQVDDVRLFKANALRASLLKKYIPPGKTASQLRTAALTDFVARNDELKKFVISDAFFTTQLFANWKNRLERDFHSGYLQSSVLTLQTCLDRGKQGPGAVVGPKTTLFFTKMFDSELTTTSEFLYEYYFHNVGSRWSKAEEIRSRDYAVKVVTGSKMSSVRKNADKDRTTCKEPVLNMFYQLGAKDVIESILRSRYHLDVSRNGQRCTQQDINRALACAASIDGQKCTIDMSNASDSTLVALCERLLPKDVWRVLDLIRCHRTIVPGHGSFDLAMVSTMGNGFTFALMTLLFTSLIQCLYELNDRPYVNGCHGGVYGDDIIVDVDMADQLIETLTSIGYTVNIEKSYLTGPFRESCGGDFYKGHDVRGVYIRSLNNETDIYSAFNRLHLWSVKHQFHLHSTLRYLFGAAKYRPVPLDMDVSSGFLCPADQIVQPSYVPQNFNPKRVNTGGIRYEYLKPVPEYVGRCMERFTNFQAGLVAFLGGFVRDDRMSLRVNNPKFIVEKASTSSWDWSPLPWLKPRDLGLFFSLSNFTE